MINKCFIFCPAWDLNSEKILAEINSAPAKIIAADGGLEVIASLGLTPDVIIGDFDSAGKLPDDPRFSAIPREVHPLGKDDTDLALAIKFALRNNFCDITIVGAIGGRPDFTLAAMLLLEFIHENGGEGTILGGKSRVRFLKNDTLKIVREYKYISIIPLRESVKGVNLRGFSYPLENAELKISNPIAVSNEISPGENSATISVTDGALLVIECDE